MTAGYRYIHRSRISANQAIDLLRKFKPAPAEKAFWTFGRGERLGDLRRLIRDYGRTESQVFPTGVFPKGGTYVTDVNLPVPQAEQNNIKFTACTDRKA